MRCGRGTWTRRPRSPVTARCPESPRGWVARSGRSRWACSGREQSGVTPCSDRRRPAQRAGQPSHAVNVNVEDEVGHGGRRRGGGRSHRVAGPRPAVKRAADADGKAGGLLGPNERLSKGAACRGEDVAWAAARALRLQGTGRTILAPSPNFPRVWRTPYLDPARTAPAATAISKRRARRNAARCKPHRAQAFPAWPRAPCLYRCPAARGDAAQASPAEAGSGTRAVPCT